MPKRLVTGVMSCVLLAGGGYSAHAQAVSSTQQQAGMCTGQVLSNTGEEVIGATVKVKGTDKATGTNIDGRFSITGVSKGAVLQISCIGFDPMEVTWNGEPLTITMTETANALDEVVVVGYGVQKKANVTGSVASMKAEQIASRPVSSVSAAMAGQMPGVTVVQSTGAPGSQAGSITVRGKNSINGGSPLVVIDGVPSTTAAMNNIAPEEIESISVLKDAASAAIYGVQAANGVILITTKKGTKDEKTRITYSGNVAWTRPTTKANRLTAYEHATLWNEAMLNDNPNAAVRYQDWELERWKNGINNATTPDIDWYDELFKKDATETQHSITLNGGTGNTNYMVSLSYLYQGGLTDDLNYNRYNGRINLSTDITKWLQFGINASAYRGIRKDSYTGSTGTIGHSYRCWPTTGIYATKLTGTDSEGHPIYEYTDELAYHGMDNPFAEVGGNDGWSRNTTDDLSTNIFLDIKPIEGLSIRPLFSWHHQNYQTRSFKKHFEFSGYDSGDREGNVNFYEYNWYTYQVVANYMKTIQKHTFSILGGYESSKYNYNHSRIFRKGGGTNDLWVLNTLATNAWSNEDDAQTLTRQSWFGRVQYDYDNRYLFEANFRADASSRFPKDTRWGYFPAFSAGWRISQESFMENTRDWLSNLKIRLGWGRTGNEEVNGYYPAVPVYSFSNNVYLGNGLYTSAFESALVNDKLKWATVTNYEFGLEASFLQNMIGFEANVYKKKTNDILLTLPILGVIGMSSPVSNAGKMENTGFEFNVFHNFRLNKDWSWNVSANVAYNKNELTDLRGTEGPDGNYILKEGQALGSYYGYVSDGFFQNQAEVDAGPKRTGTEKPGNIRYKDLNGDGKINGDDRAVIGKNFPSWTYGINLGLKYRDFDLSALFQGAADVDTYITGEVAYAFYNNASARKHVLDRWTPDNPNGSYPRLTLSAGGCDYVFSDYWLKDGSYIRLKNLTVGYTVPSNLTRKFYVEQLRIFFSGENLWTSSKLNDYGLDPEMPTGSRYFYSNVRKLSIGLKVTL